MLISDDEASVRLNSPLNLMNRLRRASPSSNKAKAAMELFTGMKPAAEPVHVPEVLPAVPSRQSSSLPSNAPTLDSILDNADTKIKQELIHNAATTAMEEAIKQLTLKLPEASKPHQLADIAAKMSRIVKDIRDDRKGVDSRDKQVHVHFYTPEAKKITEYKEIEV